MFIIVMCFWIFNVNLSISQVVKFKNLKVNEALEYIKLHNGQKKPDPQINSLILYDCDNNTLIAENTIEKRYTLYYDRNKYYEEIEKLNKVRIDGPLKKIQDQLFDIEKNKEILLNALFQELKFPRPAKLKDVDLKKLDTAIKKYGYDNAYFNLYGNLIIFCGEYLREDLKGGWKMNDNRNHPGEVIPIYVDSTGRDYGFWINSVLSKDYFEKNKIKISTIIQFALIPEIFKVVPNPSLQRPLNSKW